MIKVDDYQRILACPQCKAAVEIEGDLIRCPRASCGLTYGIKDQIPVMMPGRREEIGEAIDRVMEDPGAVMFQRKFLGIPWFKWDYKAKEFLYRRFGLRMPKLWSQHQYWLRRGKDYCDDFMRSGYERFEIFFQDLLIDELKGLDFDSFFEAGCGFGWNIRRVKSEFPDKFVGGLDFSHTQLVNGKAKYMQGMDLVLTEGAATRMPFADGAYDVGFSLGVFMNIHPARIGHAIDEMIRVCRKAVIHLEYDENHAVPELRERRAFKTNIVSHDYRALYE